MSEQSPLGYRLALYGFLIGGILFSLYANWAPGAALLIIAMIMQWNRRLPEKHEWSRRTGLIAAGLMVALDIYGIFDPQVGAFFGN